MKFYSGFSLSNDKQLFSEFLRESEFNVAGFSYGAILAFKEVLYSDKRIDTLQLFSPAFFQDKPEKFKRTQKMYYSKDKKTYLQNFFKSCFLPANINEKVTLKEGSEEELSLLLDYKWKADELQVLKDKGLKIEVYLGSEDKIINVLKAKEFFLPFATTYLINSAGHALETKDTVLNSG